MSAIASSEHVRVTVNRHLTELNAFTTPWLRHRLRRPSHKSSCCVTACTTLSAPRFVLYLTWRAGTGSNLAPRASRASCVPLAAVATVRQPTCPPSPTHRLSRQRSAWHSDRIPSHPWLIEPSPGNSDRIPSIPFNACHQHPSHGRYAH